MHSQGEALKALSNKFMSEFLRRGGCSMGGFSAEREPAAAPRSEAASSGKNGASCSAGCREGSAATARVKISAVQGMPCKTQVPQPDASHKEACRVPGKLLHQSRIGDPSPERGAAAVPISMTGPTAEIRVTQIPPAEGTAAGCTRQDVSVRHGQGAQQPDLHDMNQLAAMAAERLPQEKAARAACQEAAPDEVPEQSGPELAAQEAKQARKQAKRARQRARRAQGAAAGADSKVCSCLRLCVIAPCRASLKGCITCDPQSQFKCAASCA